MRINILITVFLCLISIGTASALLSVTSIESTHGRDYRALNDIIGINVSSSSNVSVSNVQCIKQSGTTYAYICVFNDTVNSAAATYTVRNTEGQTASKSIKVDNGIGPISYKILASQNSVKLSYTIQDLGYGNNNACSGIKTLTVYDGSSILNTFNINGVPGVCLYNGTINLSVGSSGTKAIMLEATDNVGNVKRTLAENVTLDLDAPEIINGLIVKYSATSEELSELSNSASFLVDIYFGIREQNLSSIRLDLSNANTNPTIKSAYKNIVLSLSSCVANVSDGAKVYNCVIKSVPLKISGNSLDMNVTAKDAFGNSVTSTLSKSFSIDNTVPEVSITTGMCDDAGKCYIKNGFNKIILTMNKQNFERRNVFFRLPGSIFDINRVQNCSGSECTAIVSLTCSSGSQVEISIAGLAGLSSQDDSGNPVEPSSAYVYCDNIAPKIMSMNVTGQTSEILPQSVIVSGSTLTVTAKVNEAESEKIKASLWLDKLRNGTEEGSCTRASDYDFDCAWTISNIAEGYYAANILLNVSDSVGNNDSEYLMFNVFGLRSDNETPNNLEISPRDVYPKKINRIVLDMATGNGIPYYAYATYDLSKVKGNNVSVLHQQVDLSRCEYVSEGGTVSASQIFSSIKVNNEYAGLNDIGRLDLLFVDNADPNIWDDKFTIVCNISVTVKVDNYVYRKPQQLTLEMPFELVNSKLCDTGQKINLQTLEGGCNPGVRLGRKIQKAEENWLVRQEWMSTVSSLIPKLQKLCSARNYIGEASTTAQFVSMVANGVSIYTQNSQVAKKPIQFYITTHLLDVCLSGAGTTSSSGIYSQYGSNNVFLNAAGTSLSMDRNTMAAVGESLFNRQKMAETCKGILGNACDFITCTKTDPTTKVAESIITESKLVQSKATGSQIGAGAKSQIGALPDLFGEAGFDTETWAMLTDNINVPDVKNSMIMSLATGCWPAVEYNLEKWRQTECNYVYCLKVAAYTGTDVSVCDKVKYTQYCTMIMGEIFELPFANIAKNFMENTADYVSNFLPLAAASGLRQALCPEYVGGNVLKAGKVEVPSEIPRQTYVIYACQLPLQIARWADIRSRSTMRGQFIYPDLGKKGDMCALAKCVGEEGCEFEPDFWALINQIQLPNGTWNKYGQNQNGQNKINVEANNKITEGSKTLYDTGILMSLEKFRQSHYNKATGTYDNLPAWFGPEYNKLLASQKAAGIIDDNYGKAPTTTVADSKADTDMLEKERAELKTLQALIDARAAKPPVKQGTVVVDNTPTITANTAKITELQKQSATKNLELKQANELVAKYENDLKILPTNSFARTMAEKNLPVVKEAATTLSGDIKNLESQIASLGTTNTQLTTTMSQVDSGAKYAEDVAKYNAEMEKYKVSKAALEKEINELDAKIKKASGEQNVASNNLKELNEKYALYNKCLRELYGPGSAANSEKPEDNDKIDLEKCAEDLKNKAIDASGFNKEERDALMIEKDVYDKLNLIDKVKVDKLRLGAYQKLVDANEDIKKYIGLEDYAQLDSADSKSQTYQQLLSKRNLLLKELKLCGDALQESCDTYAKRMDDELLLKKFQSDGIVKDLPEGQYDKLTKDIKDKSEELRKQIAAKDKTIKTYEQAAKLGDALYVGLQTLDAKNMLKFFSLGEWTNKWFGVNIADLIDPDRWTESVCNSENANNFGGASKDSAAISCDSGICQAVLTYAAERIELENPNKTRYYIYTSVYYISGGDLTGTDVYFKKVNVTYNVYFRGNGPELKFFKYPAELKAYDVIQNKTAFNSTEKYNQMCIEFSEPFPLYNSLIHARIYCRDIVERAFDTGSPWAVEEIPKVT